MLFENEEKFRINLKAVLIRSLSLLEHPYNDRLLSALFDSTIGALHSAIAFPNKHILEYIGSTYIEDDNAYNILRRIIDEWCGESRYLDYTCVTLQDSDFSIARFMFIYLEYCIEHFRDDNDCRELAIFNYIYTLKHLFLEHGCYDYLVENHNKKQIHPFATIDVWLTECASNYSTDDFSDSILFKTRTMLRSNNNDGLCYSMQCENIDIHAILPKIEQAQLNMLFYSDLMTG